MLTLSTLETLSPESPEQLTGRLLSVDTAFADLPRVDLDAAAEQNLLLGRTVSTQAETPAGEVRLYGVGGRFLGLGEGLAHHCADVAQQVAQHGAGEPVPRALAVEPTEALKAEA